MYTSGYKNSDFTHFSYYGWSISRCIKCILYHSTIFLPRACIFYRHGLQAVGAHYTVLFDAEQLLTTFILKNHWIFFILTCFCQCANIFFFLFFVSFSHKNVIIYSNWFWLHVKYAMYIKKLLPQNCTLLLIRLTTLFLTFE